MRVLKMGLKAAGAVCLLLIIILVVWFCLSMFTMLFLPKGELYCQAASPDGRYTVKLYRVRGSATVSDAVRGELVDNESLFMNTKNIYWEYKVHTVGVSWETDNVVVIGGVRLNVPDDTYDWRRQAE